MKATFTIIVLVCINLFSFAQPNRSNFWFFGHNAGLKFGSGTPVVLPGGQTYNNEGCAAVSDSSGILKFYTDGVTVWNRLHQVMSNGSGLMGDVSSTQSAIIMAAPGSQTEYYIFTMDDEGGPNGFRYSIVDISLNNGYGDVTSQKNIPVNTYMTEKLTSVEEIGTGNFWIATHKWNSNAFYVYKLTSSGLQTSPVISNVGAIHNNSIIQNSFGQMKFNVCGNKLALAIAYQDTVEVFDFDNATGIVSNAITIPANYHTYGIEFSKSSDLLYASTYNPSATLIQYDLTSGNASTIYASQTVLSNTADIYALQMANNGSIYVTRSNSNFLGEISAPEISGIGCNYNDNAINVDPTSIGTVTMLGLPALVSSYLRPESFCVTTTSVNNENNSSEMISILPNYSQSDFTIQSVTGSSFKIEIYNDAGTFIQKDFLSNNTSYRFGKNLSVGIYFIKLITDKTVFVKKVIKI